MPDNDLAGANVNRAFSLSATSIAIFTFTVGFLYPRFAAGEINGVLFQAALVDMGVSTFALVLASVQYYGASLKHLDDTERRVLAARADNLWSIGYQLLFLAPSLVLFTLGLIVVGVVWFALWFLVLLVGLRQFPRFRTPPSQPRSDS